jgi:acetyl-CoA carboxylase/biotin carboxylase 1
MIVDALVEYKHPVTIYIPPNGELRGGSWVVLDPKINPQHMEMFADVEARGGILEPPAASEIVFKQAHIVEIMHRCDETLKSLDAEKAAGKDVEAAISSREKLLQPIYKQIAVGYCDLHDRSGRMKGLGAIREELQWQSSRSYLHWRIRRRQCEIQARKQLQMQVPTMSIDEATLAIANMLASALPSAEDKAVVEFFESNGSQLESFIEMERQKHAEQQIFKLFASLPANKQLEMARDLTGFTRVSASGVPR